MNVVRQKIPFISLLFAPILALYLLCMYWLDHKSEWGTTFGLISNLMFIFCNAYVALALNWAQLWQSEQSKRLWKLITGIITLVFCLMLWQKTHWKAFFGTGQSEAYLFLLMFCHSIVCQLLIYLGIVRLSRRNAFSLDSNLLIVFNRYFSSAFLLTIFALLFAIVLGLGFGLLYLLGLSLSSAAIFTIIGLTLGSIPAFLLLIPVQARPYPFPYLFIFQWIALAFIGIYLAISLLRLDINIDSGMRLSTAAFLWLLAVIAHDLKKPQILLNTLTAAVGLILVAMSLYGIGLRLHSQGITESRLSILCLALLLFIGFIGIGIKALSGGKAISDRLCTYTLGIMTVALIIFIFLPLPQWTLESQTARYLDGRKNAEQLLKEDRYFFKQYGEAGEAALKKLAAHYQIDNIEGEHGIKIDSMNYELWKQRLPADIDRYFHRIPADMPLPDSLRESLLNHLWHSGEEDLQRVLNSEDPDAALFIIRVVDADQNPATPEWLVLPKNSGSYFYHYRLISNTETEEERLEENHLYFYDEANSAATIAQFAQAPLDYRPPRYEYHNILIGEGEEQIHLEMPLIEIKVE